MTNKFFILGISAAVVAMVGLFAVPSYLNQTHLQRLTIEVTGKERISKDTFRTDSDGKLSGGTTIHNFVYTPEETYEVRDSLWNGHFRAMTVYARIPEAGTCEIVLSGRRMGFFSLTQNIIEAECQQ
jgi:hypothetical protein